MYKELIDAMRCAYAYVTKAGVNPYRFVAYYKQAAVAIEELSKDLDSMNEANIALYGALPRWIPVTERLPEEDGFTLIFTAPGHAGVCYFTNGWWGGYGMDGITHWMPLPQPPKEET